MPRPVHFEIHASDPTRAIAFYSALFEWKFTQWGGPMEYWMVTTGPDNQPGINGGLVRRRGDAPSESAPIHGYVCTVDVPDIDAYIKKAASAGGKEALPKMAIPGVGWLSYYKDTEANIFAMMQNDPSAK
jgi:predicted enzyme related to lactoylglutathione lyase